MASTANRKGGRFKTDRRFLAELSALADGTLDPARQAEVQARIAASPELSVLYDRERHVTKVLYESWSTIRAPAALRIWVETERATPRKPLHRTAYGAALTGALASVLLAAVLISPTGTPAAPALSQAAALASRGPSAPAPALDPSAPSVALARDVEGIYFPNWSFRFGWRAVGQRVDHIDGRLAPHRLLRLARPPDRVHNRCRPSARPATSGQLPTRWHRATHPDPKRSHRRHLAPSWPHVRALQRRHASRGA